VSLRAAVGSRTASDEGSGLWAVVAARNGSVLTANMALKYDVFWQPRRSGSARCVALWPACAMVPLNFTPTLGAPNLPSPLTFGFHLQAAYSKGRC
jgi:hypothetical protein